MPYFQGYTPRQWQERAGKPDEYPLDPKEVVVKWVRVDFQTGKMTVEREEKIIVAGQGTLF